MCVYLITWMPKAELTGIRTAQSAEFDAEIEADEFAEALTLKGAENIRLWRYQGTFVRKVESFWTDKPQP